MKEHSLFVENLDLQTLENYVGNEHIKNPINQYLLTKMTFKILYSMVLQVQEKQLLQTHC
jgi:hypothetical protein